MALLACLTLVVPARTASADITAFLGVTPTPESRMVRGISAGLGLLVVGFEFEYANTSEDEEGYVPGLRTWSGNVLVQTPVDVARMRLYGTAGVGFYREALLDESESSTSVNLGGGVKVRLLGPLRLRLDYRVFRLQGAPLYPTSHRFYAGANLAF